MIDENRVGICYEWASRVVELLKLDEGYIKALAEERMKDETDNGWETALVMAHQKQKGMQVLNPVSLIKHMRELAVKNATPPEPRMSLTIRLPYALYERLNAEANKRGYRQQNSMIVNALDEWLENLSCKKECATCKRFKPSPEEPGRGKCIIGGFDTSMDNGPCSDYER
jgi:hypothetical protein